MFFKITSAFSNSFHTKECNVFAKWPLEQITAPLIIIHFICNVLLPFYLFNYSSLFDTSFVVTSSWFSSLYLKTGSDVLFFFHPTIAPCSTYYNVTCILSPLDSKTLSLNAAGTVLPNVYSSLLVPHTHPWVIAQWIGIVNLLTKASLSKIMQMQISIYFSGNERQQTNFRVPPYFIFFTMCVFIKSHGEVSLG